MDIGTGESGAGEYLPTTKPSWSFILEKPKQ